jgi:hypothetical protein
MMKRWWAVLAVFVMAVAAVPAVAVVVAPGSATGDSFHIDSGGSPFVSVGSGYGTFTIAATSGDTLIVFEWDTQLTPSDSQGNTFYDVEYGVGGLVAIWNTTLTATDTDTVTIHTGDPSSYAGWGVTVAGGAAGRTLASGTNGGYSTTLSSQSVNAIAIFVSSQHTGSCSTSGGTAWDVVPACLTLANFYIGSFSQNVTALTTPELSVNASGGTLDDWAWIEIPAQGPAPPTLPSIAFSEYQHSNTCNPSTLTESTGSYSSAQSALLVQVGLATKALADAPPPLSDVTSIADGEGDTFAVLNTLSSHNWLFVNYIVNETSDADAVGTITVDFATDSNVCMEQFVAVMILNTAGVATRTGITNLTVPFNPSTGVVYYNSPSLDDIDADGLVISVGDAWTFGCLESGCFTNGAIISIINATLGSAAMTQFCDSCENSGPTGGAPGGPPGQNIFVAGFYYLEPSAGTYRGGILAGSYSQKYNATFPLIVFAPLTVPPAPTNVAATSITSSGATVTWTQSTGGGIVNNSVFIYTGAGCHQLLSAYSTGGAATSYAITGLSEATHYSVAVSSWNATGQSPLSACTAFETAQPPGAPTGVAVTSITYTTATVGWTQSAGGGILNNTVFVYSGASCGHLLHAYSTGGAATSLGLTGLTEATTYSVTVAGWNSTGMSPLSSCVSFTTLTPPSLTIENVNATQFTAVYSNGSWTNATAIFLVIYNAPGPCAAGALTDGAWTKNAALGTVSYIPTPGFVTYQWNLTTSSSSGFASGQVIWVGLEVEVSASHFTFSCQQVTFTTPPPPPPPASSIDWIPLIVVTILAVSMFSFLYYNEIRKRRRGDR